MHSNRVPQEQQTDSRRTSHSLKAGEAAVALSMERSTRPVSPPRQTPGTIKSPNQGLAKVPSLSCLRSETRSPASAWQEALERLEYRALELYTAEPTSAERLRPAFW